MKVELMRRSLGPASQETLELRMGILRLDTLDGASLFKEGPNRVVQLFPRVEGFPGWRRQGELVEAVHDG